MDVVLWIFIFLIAFGVMEFMAWFTHKFIMHGFYGSYTKTITIRTTAAGGSAMTLFLFFMPW